MSNTSAPEKAFFTHLNPGIRKRHLAAFYFIAFMTICLASVINMLQPFMLSEFLLLPTDAHGIPTGKLALASEVVIIALVGTYGILSDRVGRRFIYGLGLFIVGVGFAITPLSRSLDTLLVTRCVYAIGAAAITSMLAIVLADYVVDKDRGKATGVMGFMNGLGAMFSALFLVKVPSMLTSAGYDSITAGWFTYAALAIMALVSAIVAWTLLSGALPARNETNTEKSVSVMEGGRIGLSAAKDPGVKLAYAASFVARPDLAIVALFVPLWISRFGQDVLGMSVQEAVAAAGPILACCFAASLFWAPVIGIIADRINRAGALAIALGLNTLGYGLTFFVTDPTSGMMMGVMVIIGMGQVSGVITSQVLIQQQAPAAQRGSIIGAFGFAGAVGIMVCSYAGGFLFDAWNSCGPFVLLAALNGVVGVWALLVMSKIQAPKQAQTKPAAARPAA